MTAVLVTGPSPGGIGAETVESLARGSPSTLILVGRSAAKCAPVVEAVHAIDPKINVKFVEADLANMASVRAAAQTLLKDEEVLKMVEDLWETVKSVAIEPWL